MPSTPQPHTKIPQFVNIINRWYSINARDFPWRREGVSLFQRIIAELLLQRTKAMSVARFFPQFISQFPNWDSIANTEITELEEILKPLGLWRRRASSLRSLSQVMVEQRSKFPRSYNEIRALPGIGQYIANAVLLFRDRESLPLLDVNMARLIERFFGPRKLVDIRDDPYLQALSASIVRYASNPIDTNFALLDYASQVCTASKPFCSECDLRKYCRYANDSLKISSHKEH